MKYTLLALTCLLYSGAGFSQGGIIALPFSNLPILHFQGTDSSYTDTVPVMILYCDTARQYHLFPMVKWVNDSIFREVFDTLYLTPDNSAHWLKGYETRLVDPQGGQLSTVFTVYTPLPSSAHLAYLDADKKPLKRSVVVWMAQEVK